MSHPYLYGNAVLALEKLFRLEDKMTMPDSESKNIVELQTGFVIKGDKGFRELNRALNHHHSIPHKEIAKIGLMFGNIPIKSTMLSPNYLVYVQTKDTITPVVFNAFDANKETIRRLLNDWILHSVQNRIARLTAIITTIWVAIAILVTF